MSTLCFILVGVGFSMFVVFVYFSDECLCRESIFWCQYGFFLALSLSSTNIILRLELSHLHALLLRYEFRSHVVLKCGLSCRAVRYAMAYSRRLRCFSICVVYSLRRFTQKKGAALYVLGNSRNVLFSGGMSNVAPLVLCCVFTEMKNRGMRFLGIPRNVLFFRWHAEYTFLDGLHEFWVNAHAPAHVRAFWEIQEMCYFSGNIWNLHSLIDL